METAYTCDTCGKVICAECRVKYKDGDGNKTSRCRPCDEERIAREKQEDKDRMERHLASKDHWLPDAAAPTCMACPAEFGLLTRRHHCRFCGGIYCSKCCSVYDTTDREGKDLRLCERCVHIVEQRDRGLSRENHAMLIRQAQMRAKHGGVNNMGDPVGGPPPSRRDVEAMDPARLAALLRERLGVQEDVVRHLERKGYSGMAVLARPDAAVADLRDNRFPPTAIDEFSFAIKTIR